MNITIVFIFLVSVVILWYHFRKIKFQRYSHKQLVLDYEKQIQNQVHKKGKINDWESNKQSNIIFQKLDIIKQQITILEVISKVSNT